MNTSKPPFKCRNCLDDVKTKALMLPWDEIQREPVDWLDGIRHRGGMIEFRALMLNCGNLYGYDKRKAQMETP